jgi:hypothetical protein
MKLGPKKLGSSLCSAVPFVSTVCRDEIREYIKNNGREDQRLDQLGLWK